MRVTGYEVTKSETHLLPVILSCRLAHFLASPFNVDGQLALLVDDLFAGSSAADAFGFGGGLPD